LYEDSSVDVWLVDCGDYHRIKEWLAENKKRIAGVFLTHTHWDHMYGLKELLAEEPMTLILLSSNEGLKNLADIRLNLTKFTPAPFIIEPNNYKELVDGEIIPIFKDCNLIALYTIGHSQDSVSFKADKYLFTGDAYIPSLEVVTKLPGGDKNKAFESLERIMKMIEKEGLEVLPGHKVRVETLI
jgi:glyoxylase-like metal-dependent hydrolase (beta-lactamase superfamily II)